MSTRLAEWLDQYNEVSQRQQKYLDQIRELRQNMQTRSDPSVIITVDKMRTSPRKPTHRKYPVYTLTRMVNNTVDRVPEPFPSRPYVFHNAHAYRHAQSNFHMVPNITPRKLEPIARTKTNRCIKEANSTSYKDSPRPLMNSMKTEYEPFESIARRNKLSLNQILNSSVSYRQPGHRIPVNMSTVNIISEANEDDERNPRPAGHGDADTSKSLPIATRKKND